MEYYVCSAGNIPPVVNHITRGLRNDAGYDGVHLLSPYRFILWKTGVLREQYSIMEEV